MDALSTSPVNQIADTPLSNNEKYRLKRLEDMIERGIEVYRQVGEALAQIRDLKLYRQKYPSFERYCAEKWGLSRQHAIRMITAAIVADNIEMSPRGDGKVPETERQARVLAMLPSDLQAECWREIRSEIPHPTAKQVADGVEHFAIKRWKELPPKLQVRLINDSERELLENTRARKLAEDSGRLHRGLLRLVRLAGAVGNEKVRRTLESLAKKVSQRTAGEAKPVAHGKR